MYEASKTRLIRSIDFSQRYLMGSVLDIGAGEDLICPWAVRFDKEDGDANDMSQYFESETFDTVHSSHTLEHMINPVRALNSWWELVRPGGWLVLVVPDEELYEQNIWPSLFNPDHKSSFRFQGQTNRADSYNLKEMCLQLPSARVISYERQDFGLNYSLIFNSSNRPKILLNYFSQSIARRLGGKRTIKSLLAASIAKTIVSFGHPVDQTLGSALAQIQVILRKSMIKNDS
jgi:SAM-dependent methyltransferase